MADDKPGPWYQEEGGLFGKYAQAQTTTEANVCLPLKRAPVNRQQRTNDCGGHQIRQAVVAYHAGDKSKLRKRSNKQGRSKSPGAVERKIGGNTKD